VYDAVTKIAGRYTPYHDFTFSVVPGASMQAAVAAAARTTLDNYLPDQKVAVDTEYNAYLATLTGDVANWRHDRRGCSERHHRFRTGDGLSAVHAELRRERSDPARAMAAAAQSEGADAVARDDAPFLLESASQFRADPPPSLTSRQ